MEFISWVCSSRGKKGELGLHFPSQKPIAFVEGFGGGHKQMFFTMYSVPLSFNNLVSSVIHSEWVNSPGLQHPYLESSNNH